MLEKGCWSCHCTFLWQERLSLHWGGSICYILYALRGANSKCWVNARLLGCCDHYVRQVLTGVVGLEAALVGCVVDVNIFGVPTKRSLAQETVAESKALIERLCWLAVQCKCCYMLSL
eukprot:GHUV01013563.1.p3 GENE.GHUV01013563.1~~GHUV01013563.1.p3  ORF type:complete len:118 (+),score=13.62 GHUV01013563.1:1014-1367(+)